MRSKLLYGSLIAALVLYLVSVFVFKTDSTVFARYHVNDTELRLLSLIFLIPTFALWFVAFYSIDKISSYAERIKKTKDGRGMQLLSRGLMVLGFGTVINGLLSRALKYAVDQGVVHQSLQTIVSAELSVSYLLICFLLFFLGARQLYATARKNEIPLMSFPWVTIGTLLISVPYVYAVLSNPSRTVATGSARTATYAMPDLWILIGIVIPYLVAWTFGFYAVALLRAYQQQVGGLLYKQALDKLTKGFLAIILLTVILQFISAFSPIILGWVLGAMLLFIIAILVTIVIGYIYIAWGAKKLTKLEEVT